MFKYLCYLICLILSQAHGNVARIESHLSDVLNFVQPLLPLNPTILEAGAFDGTDSIAMAQYWPKGTIHSFEPFPKLFTQLFLNTLPYSNIKKYSLALADQTGTKTFYLGYRGSQPSGSSSLLPAKEYLDFDQGVTFSQTLKVKAISLDDWATQQKIDHIDFMWLDRHGYELTMLEASSLLQNTYLIYMEVEFVEAYEGQYLYPEVKARMEQQGFELIATDFDEDPILNQADTIFPGSSTLYYGNAIFRNKN